MKNNNFFKNILNLNLIEWLLNLNLLTLWKQNIKLLLNFKIDS
jgi:hypothetical protein